MICLNCGEQLEERANFCWNCGAKVEKEVLTEELPAEEFYVEELPVEEPIVEEPPLRMIRVEGPIRSRGRKTRGSSIVIIILVILILLALMALAAIIINGKNKPIESGSKEEPVAVEENSETPEAAEEPEAQTSEESEEVQEEEPAVSEEPTVNYVRDAYSSSTLPADGVTTYYPSHVMDGSLTTGWSEGVSGPGIGEWLEVYYDQDIVGGLVIYNGYHKTEDLYWNNNRAKDVEFLFSNGKKYSVTFEDINGEPQLVVFDNLGKTNGFRLTIQSIYPTNKYDDTMITEIYPFDGMTASGSQNVIYATLIDDGGNN